MKKLLCALIFCLSFISAFAWEVIDARDEFGDLTGKKQIVHGRGNRGIVIQQDESQTYLFAVSLGGNILGQNIEIVRVKIDNSEPFELKCIVYYGHGFGGYIDKEYLNLFANGKVIKFSIPDQNGLYNLERFDLTGLKEAIKEAKW